MKRYRYILLISLLYILSSVPAAAESPFSLSGLDGSNGFRIDGIEHREMSEGHVPNMFVTGAGDFNGDGFDDMVIGSYGAGNNDAGEAFLVFGKYHGWDQAINLQQLDGSDGFKISGFDQNDFAGWSAGSAGDFNGDGYDDVIIGACGADIYGETDAGESYVIFGQGGGWSADFSLSSLNGSNGLRLYSDFDYCYSGWSVRGAGDINGDGYDDILIGSHRGYTARTSGQYGRGYVIFGDPDSATSSLNLDNIDHQDNGFIIDSNDTQDRDAYLVMSGAGDINGDGISDFIAGSPLAGDYGRSCVVFGKTTPWDETFELTTLKGSNGFIVKGIDNGGRLGYSVSGAGDINGDGYDDIIIGAYLADPGGNQNAGKCYVIFGGQGAWSKYFDLEDLDGNNGFVFNGAATGDQCGYSVAGAGDINSDGYDDIIIGARSADPGGNQDAGECYLLYGHGEAWSASLVPADLDGTNGRIITGSVANQHSGTSVNGAGDINHDGAGDLVIGASGDDSVSAVSYTVFGEAPNASPTAGFRTALDFDGIDDHIIIPEPGRVSFCGEDDFTVSLWISPEYPASGWAELFRHRSPAYESLQVALQVSSRGTIRAALGREPYYNYNGGWWQSSETGAAAGLNRWTHVTMVKTDDTARIYLNGLLEAESTIPSTWINAKNGRGDIYIGHFEEDNYYQGQMDEVRIWNTALAANRIQDWMYREIDIAHPAYGNLVSYYRLNEGSGTTAGDGKWTNHGTLVNMDENDWVDSTVRDWSIDEDTILTGRLVGSDGSDTTLSFSLQSQAEHGTVELTGGNSFTYTPEENWSGTDSFTYRVSDGPADSDPHTTLLTVVPVDDAPVLGGLETAALQYTENDPAAAISAAITVFDVEGTTVEWATVRITDNYRPDQDMLEFPDTASITGEWDPVTGTMTLSGDDTVDSYQAALRTAAYRNSSENPDTATRAALFTVSAGNLESNQLSRDISITPLNDPPVTGFGTAMVFDQGNDYISIGNVDELNFSGYSPYTIEAWIKFYHGTNGTIAAKYKSSDGYTEYRLFVDADGYLYSYRGNSADVVQSPEPLPSGHFTHVATTFDENRYLRLYVDGVEVAGKQCTGSLPGHDTPVLIGAIFGANNSPYRHFKGAMDEVRFWNAALTGDQVSDWLGREVESGHPAYENLVTYYQFNATGGSMAVDSTGNAHGTILSEDLTTQTAMGTSLSFDGVDDYLYIGNVGALAFNGYKTYTIEAWVRFNPGADGVIIGKYKSDGATTYRLRVDSDGYLYSYRNAHPWVIKSSKPLPAGEYCHVATTFDTNHHLRLFIDGLEVASAVYPTNPPGGDTPVLIGASLDAVGQPDHFFHGEMDELRIWKTAQTPTSMLEWIGREVDDSHPDHADLVLYYQFNKNEGTTAIDSAGTANGELRNMAPDNWIDSTVALVDRGGRNDAIVLSYSIEENTPVSGWLVGTDPDGTSGGGSGWNLDFSIETQGALGYAAITGVNGFTYTPYPYEFGVDSFTYTVDDGVGEPALGTVTVGIGSVEDPLTVGFGNALEFDGVDDFIDCGAITGAETGGQVTIEAWIHPLDTDKQQGLVAHGAGNAAVDTDHVLAIDQGNLEYRVHTGTGWETFTQPVESGRWQHVACTVDSYKQVIIYVDGTGYVQGTVTGSITPSAEPWLIGQSGEGEHFFEGLMDEVRIWRTALAPETIRAWIYREIDRSHPDYAELAGYYKFNEENGTEAAESRRGLTSGSVENMDDGARIESTIAGFYSTNEDTTVTGHLVGSDPDGSSTDGLDWSLDFSIKLPGQYSEVTIIGVNSFSCIPDQNWSGTDTFRYQASDGKAYSPHRTVTVDFSIIDDPPMITGDRYAYTALHRFTGKSTGSNPSGSPLLHENTLYGTTARGGANYKGTVFKINTDGSGFEFLHQFAGGDNDGAYPYGSPAMIGNTLFGLTSAGGWHDKRDNNEGVIFKINTDGTGFHVMREFNHGEAAGAKPYGSLTAFQSTLWGMTSTTTYWHPMVTYSHPGYNQLKIKGIIFSINQNGSGYARKHHFHGLEAAGSTPFGSLSLDDNGVRFFGMTKYGGDDNKGVVFTQRTSGGAVALLHEFSGGANDGADPFGSLTVDGSTLYGMTNYGGDADQGVIFTMDSGGNNFDLLHEFSGSDGANPRGSLILHGDTLYGLTDSTVFRINTDGAGFRILHRHSAYYSHYDLYDSSLVMDEATMTLYGYGDNCLFSMRPEPLADLVIDEDIGSVSVPVVIHDPDTDSADITVTVSSDNQVLIPDATIIVEGTGPERTVYLTPAADRNGTAIITVNADDGTTTTSESFTVTVNAVNDGPLALSGMETSAVQCSDDTRGATLTSSLLITSSEPDKTLDAAIVQITSNYSSGEDMLLFLDTTSITGSWNTISGTLTLSGHDTLANYQAALRAVQYMNLTMSPDNSVRTVAVIVNDGDYSSNAVSRDIELVAVNDPPSAGFGTALRFDGADDYIHVGDYDDLAFSGLQPYTMEAWIMTGPGSEGTITAKYGGPGRTSHRFFVDEDGYLYSYRYSPPYVIQSPSPLTAGKYTHVATTYDTSRQLRLYINGVEVAGEAFSLNNASSSGTPFLLGACLNKAGNLVGLFEGVMDEVRIWDTALTGTQMQDWMYREVDTTHPVYENLLLYYRFNEGGGFTAVDSSGGHHGTLRNMENEDWVESSIAGSFSASVYTPVSGRLVGSDPDGSSTGGSDWSLEFSIVSQGTKGTAVIEEGNQFTYTYDPFSGGTDSFTYRVSDGEIFSEERTISIEEELDQWFFSFPPSLAGLEESALQYDENGPAVPVSSSITVQDFDSPAIKSARVRITDNYCPGEDTLSFTGTGSITDTWNPDSGVMILAGGDPPANYQAALRAVKYENSSDTPETAARTVTFSVNDEEGGSNVVTRDIAILAVNDQPVVTAGEDPLFYTAGNPPAVIAGGLIITDEDDTVLSGATATVTVGFTAGEDTLSAVAGAGMAMSYDDQTGVLELSGTAPVSDYQDALRSVTFSQPETGTPGITRKVITFTASDGDLADSGTVVINVMDESVAAGPPWSGHSGSLAAVDTDGNGHLDEVRIVFDTNLAPEGNDIRDWRLIDADGSTDLLAGLTDDAISIDGNCVIISLDNGTGSAQLPMFAYRENGRDGALKDLDDYPIGSWIDQENHTPEAQTGTDRETRPTLVVLSAASSTDPDNQTLTCTWSQTTGPVEVTLRPHPDKGLANAAAADSPVLEPRVSFIGRAAGAYIFNLVVEDPLGATCEDDITITVTNISPTACAGRRRLVNKDDDTDIDMVLNGSESSDANSFPGYRDIEQYSWIQLDGPADVKLVTYNLPEQLDTHVSCIGFDTSVLPAGIYTFQLEVTDRGEMSDTDTVRVIVNDPAGNTFPDADTGLNQTVFIGRKVRLDGHESKDPDGDRLSFSWRQISGISVELQQADTVHPSFIPVSPGTCVFELTVNDGQADSFPDLVEVNVISHRNRPPASGIKDPVKGTYWPKVRLVEELGVEIALEGKILGSSDDVTARWVQSAGPTVIFEEDALETVIAPVEEGVYRFRLEVSRDGMAGRSAEAVVSVISADMNPPVAEAGSNQLDRRSGEAVTLDGTGSVDADDDPIRYRWTQLQGPTVVLTDDTAAEPGFTPSETGVYQFELVVTDGALESAPDSVYMVVHDDDNSVPTARVEKEEIHALPGVMIVLNGIQSRDSDPSDTMVYQWVQTAGPIIQLDDPFSAVPSFIPQYEGIYVFELYVDDGNDRSIPQPVTVSVGDTGPGGAAGSETGPPCFIATAAFGTPLAEEVVMLKHLRDDYLAHTEYGRTLVACYYRFSPPAARVIRDDDQLRHITRMLLAPAITMLNLSLH